MGVSGESPYDWLSLYYWGHCEKDFIVCTYFLPLSGGIRRIRVEDCAFTRGANSIFIKSREDRAGYIEEITGKNLDCRATTFLVIDLLDKGIKDEEPVTGIAGWTAARRIVFSKVKVNVQTLLDAHLLSADKPLDGLSISDVTGTWMGGNKRLISPKSVNSTRTATPNMINDLRSMPGCGF